MKPAYLIAGDDEAKIGAAVAALRARAEREGGPGALEAFSPRDGVGAPDVEALAAAIPAMSLTATRRYLVADRLERVGAKHLEGLAAALADLPPDVTVVLVERPAGGRERPQRARVAARKAVVAAVENAGGRGAQLRGAEGARPARAGSWLTPGSESFDLELDAAKLLVERMGARTGRLANELDRLALWAGPGGRVTLADLSSMVADTSEEVAWALSDAIVERDAGSALAAVERLSTRARRSRR